MYGSPHGNKKQLNKFLIRIGQKRAELERKQKDLDVMLDDLQRVEDECQLALTEYDNELNNAIKAT